MTDREEILKSVFGSVQNFMDSGEKYCRRMGMHSTILEDMISEYCLAGFDSAGRVDTEKTILEQRAFITDRAKGAVRDAGRVAMQSRRKYKVTMHSMDMPLTDNGESLYDMTESHRFQTPLDALTTQEEKERFQNGLKTLPQFHRELIEATLDGQMHSKIAESMGVSKQAISKAYGIAVENLRRAVA